MKQNKRLKCLCEIVERERVDIDSNKTYHNLIKLGGLYDLMVREQDRLVLNRAFKL